MSQYLVTTPLNPDYNGKTFGVRFDRGRAVVNDYSIDKTLGLTVDEIAERMEKEFNYTVEKIEGGNQAWTAPEPVEAESGDWVKELEVAVKSRKKRAKAGAGEAPEDSDSEA